MVWLDILMRIAHILGAVTLLGGILYGLFGLAPSLHVLDDDFRTKLIDVARKRFNRVLHPAIGLLLLSGVYNWWRNMGAYVKLKEPEPEMYMMVHMLLGLKVLGSITILIILFAQDMGRLQRKPTQWMAINLALGVTVVAMAAGVRWLRLQAMAV